MLIFKIFRANEWELLSTSGETKGSPVDVADGFVHFSTAAQAPATAAQYFAGADGLILAAVKTDGLDAVLKWEPSRDGALFPHLYRPLRRADVLWTKPLPLVNGKHSFPAEMV